MLTDGDIEWMRKRRERIISRAYLARPEVKARRAAYMKEYRAKNLERLRANDRFNNSIWRELNPEKNRAKNRAYRAKKRAEKLAAKAEQLRAEEQRKKDLRRAQQRRYYAKHKEKCRAMTQAWLEKNPDYQRQADRDRYMLDPEKKKARSRAYYAANREAIIAKRRAGGLKLPNSATSMYSSAENKTQE